MALLVPFCLWNPSAFWFGMVQFHMYNLYRPDSLSVVAAVAATTGYYLSPLLGFLAAGAVALLLLRRQATGWLAWGWAQPLCFWLSSCSIRPHP